MVCCISETVAYHLVGQEIKTILINSEVLELLLITGTLEV